LRAIDVTTPFTAVRAVAGAIAWSVDVVEIFEEVGNSVVEGGVAGVACRIESVLPIAEALGATTVIVSVDVLEPWALVTVRLMGKLPCPWRSR